MIPDDEQTDAEKFMEAMIDEDTMAKLFIESAASTTPPVSAVRAANKELYGKLCAAGNEVHRLAQLAEDGCTEDEWEQQRLHILLRLLALDVITADDIGNNSFHNLAKAAIPCGCPKPLVGYWKDGDRWSPRCRLCCKEFKPQEQYGVSY